MNNFTRLLYRHLLHGYEIVLYNNKLYWARIKNPAARILFSQSFDMWVASMVNKEKIYANNG